MLTSIRFWLVEFIAPDYADMVKGVGDRRYAALAAELNPWDIVLQDFNGVFSVEYDRPEDALDGAQQMTLEQWAWMQAKAPHFNYLIEWIMNTNANQTLKRATNPGNSILYCRALLAAMVLFRKEVRRLASKYEDRLKKDKVEDFSPAITVE